ncbi:cell division protein SepF [uncultured Gemmiger sp.]|uniref:cell division protein SepF n=1 Tax=uncultured Gemmiger sp. TaxID=1623490 RepID=UPI0025E5E626|nr:cell division protein SepF [uncultured Gemmiger sp.]
MSMFEGFKNMLGINQDPEDDEYLDGGEDEVFAGNGQNQAPEDNYAQPDSNRQRNNKVVNINATTQLQVVLVKPERFEDASAIADQLNAKRTVVLNLESTNKQVSRRLIDFLSGVAYANNGQIKRVATSTFIITPYNVDIMGDLIDELENNGVFF